MLIQAVKDKIVVQELKKEKSKGGLIIPDSVQQPQSFGTVLSKGDDITSNIEEGDVLVFHNNAGMAMVVEGKVLRCLMENEVYGIVKSKEVVSSLTPCEVKQKDLDQLDSAIKKAQTKVAGSDQRIIRV